MISRFLDFLFSLEKVHISEGAHFNFVAGPTALVIFGALLLGILGYVSYIPQTASPAKKKWMGVFRGVLLAVVLMLACRPEIVVDHENPQRSAVAVWVDNSASMSLADPYVGKSVNPAMRAYMEKIAGEIRAAATAPGAAGGAGISRYQLATGTLSDAGWLKKLTETQDILFFTGGARAQNVGAASKPGDVDARIADLKALKPDGNATDVPTVVRDILDRTQGRRLSAIILLSDGQTTERGSRLDQSAEFAHQVGAEVFALPLGQEEEPFNLKISSMQVPKSTFTRDPVTAKVHVVATGLDQPLVVKVSIYRQRGNAPIDASTPALVEKEVTLDPSKKELDVELPTRLKKTEPGQSERFDLVAKITPVGPAPEERTQEDNTVTGAVTVLDAQINVLYVEGYPRWEFRYLRNELIREPTVNVSTLLNTATDPGFVQDADPPVFDKATNKELFPGPLNHFPDTMEDLDKYHVLLIGDVDPTYFSPAQQKLILDWVRTKGGGVGFIAGHEYNPESYRESALEVLLPVVPDEIDPRARLMAPSDNTPYRPMLTPAGRDTNLFRFFDDPEESWKQVDNLEDMYWFKPVQGLKPGAIVLAMNPNRSQAGNPAPLLVMRQFGAGSVIFSAYCDTWRWRRYTGEPLFQSYWLQFCRLLSASKALSQSKRLELIAEDGRVEIGGQIKLSLTVKDPTLTGQLPAEVPVNVVDKATGKTVQTIMLDTPGGGSGSNTAGGADAGALEKITGSATAQQLGKFSLVPQPGVLPVEIPPGDLEVEEPQREFQNTIVDLQSLRSIASRTGGTVVLPCDNEELRKLIPDRSLNIASSTPEELWDKPFALVLVVLLATIEWLLRKNAGLI